MVFETGSGVHVCEILSDDRVKMGLKIPNYKSEHLSVGGCMGFFIDSGARHFVVESENLNDDYVLEMGRKIRYASEFKPDGINVNFYREDLNGNVEIKTYEKGVEQVMLSCASGSAAVVFHLSKINVICSPVTTCSPGGNLIYTFDDGWSDFLSEGPAEFIFKGTFCLGK
jgi:diaminopimelate epimerase